MKKFVFSVASRATGRLQIKSTGSGDENELVCGPWLATFPSMIKFFFRREIKYNEQ